MREPRPTLSLSTPFIGKKLPSGDECFTSRITGREYIVWEDGDLTRVKYDGEIIITTNSRWDAIKLLELEDLTAKS